jgi:hypothetical protein
MPYDRNAAAQVGCGCIPVLGPFALAQGKPQFSVLSSC